MEWLDIYDDKGRRTGKQADRGAMRLEEHENIKVVHLCVFNQEGRLLMQKRNAAHGSFADCWDLSAGGAVRAGEESEDAVRREAAEELGLYPDEEDEILFIKCYRIPHVFDDFYLLFKNIALTDLSPDPSEVTELRWMTLEEIRQQDEQKCLVDYGMELIRDVFSIAGEMKR